MPTGVPARSPNGAARSGMHCDMAHGMAIRSAFSAQKSLGYHARLPLLRLRLRSTIRLQLRIDGRYIVDKQFLLFRILVSSRVKQLSERFSTADPLYRTGEVEHGEHSVWTLIFCVSPVIPVSLPCKRDYRIESKGGERIKHELCMQRPMSRCEWNARLYPFPPLPSLSVSLPLLLSSHCERERDAIS